MIILALGALSGFLGWALILIAVFSHITMIQRVLRAKSILNQPSEPEMQKP
jgi:archaetidylinositol phosphate synthase